MKREKLSKLIFPKNINKKSSTKSDKIRLIHIINNLKTTQSTYQQFINIRVDSMLLIVLIIFDSYPHFINNPQNMWISCVFLANFFIIP